MTIFEKIIAREIPADIVFEDQEFIAFRDINPQAPIHVLVVPKKKISRIGEMNETDCVYIGRLLYAGKQIAEQLGVNSTDKGFRMVINHGKNGGETVPHLHLHLLAGRHLAWPPG